jgi:hypothetical protein
MVVGARAHRCCVAGRRAARCRRACARCVAGWLAWLLSAAVAGHVEAQAAEFAISGPAALVLGKVTDTTLLIRAPEGAHFHVYSNVGQLGAAQHIASEQWQVAYTLPVQHYPQRALIALVSDDGAKVAWTSIALHGSAHVEIQSEPEVLVEVRVGQNLYGPTTTDRAGHAELAVEVPPGYDTAVSVATDALGNQKERDIALGVPAVARVLSVCVERTPLQLLAFVVDGTGAQQSGAQLQASGTNVRVRSATELGHGMYRIVFDPVDAAGAGTKVQLSAALRAQAATASGCDSVIPSSAPQPSRQQPMPDDAAHSGTRFVVGLQGGYLTNFAKVHGPLLQLIAAARLPVLRHAIGVGLQLGYHASQSAGPSADQLERIDTRLSGLSALGRASYTFALDPVELWLFGAAGVLFVSSRVSGPLAGTVRESNGVVSYSVGAGADVSAGPGRVGLELSYTRAMLDARALHGNAAGFGATLGYRLEL